jgi:hypothetical protein
VGYALFSNGAIYDGFSGADLGKGGFGDYYGGGGGGGLLSIYSFENDNNK